ncbi:MAG: ATP-binding cassette domain-containing protein [Bacteroidia bacterium]|nr:ATP-binding cassette domain-containing protein [Bacteroidia bacterium]
MPLNCAWGGDTQEETIGVKIEDVLKSLFTKEDIEKIYYEKVKKLSGGQRKRVSIAVELLNNPSILFLDEPTSPLDPETIKEFLTRIRDLTQKGATVVMVTHKPEDLKYVDKVIFLAAGGHLVYYGAPNESLQEHFETEDVLEIYQSISKEENVEFWNEKWNRKKTEQSKAPSYGTLSKNQESLLSQFLWLSRRYFKIKWSDKSNMLLLAFQPLAVAGLLALIFTNFQLSIIFLMVISAIWFGVSNAAKEIVGELPIFFRERMFNLNIYTYVLSKLGVLILVALLQVAFFVLIIFLRYRTDTISIQFPLHYLGFMFLIAFSATLLGLLLSATSSTTEKVMTNCTYYSHPPDHAGRSHYQIG